MSNVKTNKITKRLDIIAIVIIIVLVIIYASNKVLDYQTQKINIKCDELSQILNDSNLIDSEYNVEVIADDHLTLKVIVDIYNYEEEMQINFEHLYDLIYKEVVNSNLKEDKFKEVRIVFFDYTKDADGNGATGVGIDEKVFDL